MGKKSLALPKDGICSGHAENIRLVLGGDTKLAIWGMFVWSGTPQGHKHWENIAEGRTKLSLGDRSYLNKCLRSYMERTQ